MRRESYEAVGGEGGACRAAYTIVEKADQGSVEDRGGVGQERREEIAA